MFNSNKVLDGDWNLPSTDVKIPGRLNINHSLKEINLHLFSDRNLNGKEIEFKNPRSYDFAPFDLILGETSLFTKVTLLHCSSKGIQFIGTELVEMTYSIGFVFFGVHFIKLEEFIVEKAKLRFPNISSFYDGWETHDKKLKENLKDAYDEEEVIINSDLRISFKDFRDDTEISVKGVFQTKLIKYIEFKYERGLEFLSLKRDCFTFLKMLEFNFRDKVGYDIQYVMVKQQNVRFFDESLTGNGMELRIYVQSYSEKGDIDIFIDDIVEWKMLFSSWSESKEEINKIIAKWFENKALHPIYEFYIDANDWFTGKNLILSNVHYNNKFLNLIQGLESYFDLSEIDNVDKITNEEFTKNRQLILNSLGDDELKKWARNYLKFPKDKVFLENKLESFLIKYSVIIEKIVFDKEFLESYSSEAKEYRHKLSHGNISKTY